MKHKYGKAWKEPSQLPKDTSIKLLSCIRFAAEIVTIGSFDPEIKMFRFADSGEPVLELEKWCYLPVRIEDL